MAKPTARADRPLALSGAVTVMSICISPWWNLSVSSWVALADSEVGSWNPLEERLLATGTPKMPAASITNRVTAMTRRGAAIASNAIRCSTSRPPCTRGRKIGGNLITVSQQVLRNSTRPGSSVYDCDSTDEFDEVIVRPRHIRRGSRLLDSADVGCGR